MVLKWRTVASRHGPGLLKLGLFQNPEWWVTGRSDVSWHNSWKQPILSACHCRHTLKNTDSCEIFQMSRTQFKKIRDVRSALHDAQSVTEVEGRASAVWGQHFTTRARCCCSYRHRKRRPVHRGCSSDQADGGAATPQQTVYALRRMKSARTQWNLTVAPVLVWKPFCILDSSLKYGLNFER